MRATAAVLAVGGCLALGLGTPAEAGSLAKGLTKGKVQQIAAKVVQQQAPKLTVARATTADDAAKLGGLAPAAYLDRVAQSLGVSNPIVAASPVGLADPVTISVPVGVGAVRVTGVAGFTSVTSGQSHLFLVAGTDCAAASFSSGSFGSSNSGVTIDRVVEVSPGDRTFTLCGNTSVDATVLTPSLTVETVAVATTD